MEADFEQEETEGTERRREIRSRFLQKITTLAKGVKGRVISDQSERVIRTGSRLLPFQNLDADLEEAPQSSASGRTVRGIYLDRGSSSVGAPCL